VITAWRMPLTRLAEEFASAGFLIERLVEPVPEPEMAITHPEAFEKLSVEPGFVLFRLRKGDCVRAPPTARARLTAWRSHRGI
jgi:hypothetical protein